jgi:hypothetical protein
MRQTLLWGSMSKHAHADAELELRRESGQGAGVIVTGGGGGGGVGGGVATGTVASAINTDEGLESLNRRLKAGTARTPVDAGGGAVRVWDNLEEPARCPVVSLREDVSRV